MTANRMNPAQRRYTWRFLSAMTVYVFALLFTNLALAHWHPAGVTLVAVSVLPALPLLAAITALGLYIVEEADEYLRQRNMTAMLGATGFLLAIATIWGFMEQGGVVQHVPAWAAFPLWAIGLGLSQGVLAARDKMGVDK